MLTSKQRAYLRGLANNIDTIIFVGKGGLGEQIYKESDNALAARELIKGKCLENSPVTPREAADAISEHTDSDVVQVIGSKFVLYRPDPDEPVIKLPKTKK